MQVTTQYASEHLAELFERADRGEEVEVFREGLPVGRILTVPAPVTGRIPRLGAGRGELRVPTDEEWKAMDKELEDLVLNSPLISRSEDLSCCLGVKKPPRDLLFDTTMFWLGNG